MSTPESAGATPNEVPPYTPSPHGQSQYGGPQQPYAPNLQAQHPYGGYPPGQTPKSSSGLALTAFILGIAAFLLPWVPVLGVMLGLAAVVVGIVALVKRQTRWMALVGTILGSLGLITALIITLAFSSFMAGFDSTQAKAPDSSTSASETPDAAAPAITEEPTAVPPPAPAAPDLSTFAPTDERTFALIAKDPDAYIGTNLIVFGSITQLDSATGRCNMLVSAGAAQTEFSYDYGQNTLATSGDGESDCPIFDPLVEGDHVKMWVTILGSYSYDTQIGGNTTVPLFEVLQAELLPAQEY